MKKYIITAAAIILAQSVQAQVLYWNMPTTAEQVAYGNGCFMQSVEPQGLMLNPSSLGFIKYRSFSASGIQWWQDIYGGSSSAVLPARKYGAVSLALGYWSLGSVSGYTDEGQPTGTIQAQAANLALGYGLALADAWGLGLALKSSRLELPDRSDWSYSWDMALSYKRGPITGCLMVRDIGPDYPKSNDTRQSLIASDWRVWLERMTANNDFRQPLNTTYLAGVKTAWLNGMVVGSAQYNIRKEDGGYPSLALELIPLSDLNLKIGYEKVPELAERSPLGLGAEISRLGRRDLSVAYGYRSYGDMGNIQAITLGVSF